MIVNGLFVAAFALVVGGLLVGISIPATAVPGDRARHPRQRRLVHGARACRRPRSGCARATRRRSEHRVRHPSVFSGVNVPLSALPGWMSTIAQGLPLTHGIEAARRLADGTVASIGRRPDRRGGAVGTPGACSATRSIRRSNGTAGSTRPSNAHEERNRGQVCKTCPSPCSTSAGLLDRLRFHVKSLTHSLFFLLTSIFMPLLVATVAYYMFKAGRQPGRLLYASLGAGVYGIWSSTLFGSGGAIQWQRWQGTLEVLVSAPTPFFLVIAPLTLATSMIGIYSLVATLFWGRLVFGIPFHVAHRPRSASRSRDDPRPRAAGHRLRLDVRPLSQRERPLEHARVAGAARHRDARAAGAAALLVAADRRGCWRRPGAFRRSERRPSAVTLAGDRDDHRARARVPRAGSRLPAPLRDASHGGKATLSLT